MSAAPVRIENDTATGQLRLYWHEGGVSTIAHQQLRDNCRCASCRAALLQGEKKAAPVSVRLVQLGNMGYGAQLVFDDGHDRGIFPWAYLRELATTAAPPRSAHPPA